MVASSPDRQRVLSGWLEDLPRVTNVALVPCGEQLNLLLGLKYSGNSGPLQKVFPIQAGWSPSCI
jgi:hypothetical protein